jgi:hypothetical protein
MNLQLLNQIEALRIPLDDPVSALSWKDWYHYVLLDLQTGVRSLVNMTLMGRPDQGEVQVSCLVSVPSELLDTAHQGANSLATFGSAFSLEWQRPMLHPSPLQLHGKGISLEITGTRSHLQMRDERAQVEIQFTAEAEANPLLVTEDAPFGSGFIGWGLVPGVRAQGKIGVCGQSFPIDHQWFCYHDRNFGCFRWGEDIGWEWFVATSRCVDGQPFTFVLDWRTNKNHSQGGLPYIFVYRDRTLVKIFLGSGLRVTWDWSDHPIHPVRLPGIMASLFGDRTLRMPQRLQIEVADDQDYLLMNVQFDASAELIVPDNQARQYTFIEEVSGRMDVRLALRGETLTASGLVYAEYVH